MAPAIDKKLSSSLVQRGRFYRDEDIAERIQDQEAKKHLWLSTLSLAYSALGVIYGDIGTSPLYVFASIFTEFEPTTNDVLGAISLIFWSITLLVLIKYVFIVIRANDQGEGGTFALYTRLCRTMGIQGAGQASKKEEQVEAIQTAAAVRTVTRASTLMRRTQSGGHSVISEMRRTMSGAGNPVLEPSAVNPAEVVIVAAERNESTYNADARIGAAGPPAAQSASKMFHKALHWAPFPAEATKRFFQDSSRARFTLLVVSVLATAMVIGDGVLTPAISVVSAVSGLTIRTSISQNGIIGVSVAILVCLFAMQSFGTQRVAFLFSPVIVLWMACIFGIGAYNMSVFGSTVLQGLSPHWIVIWFMNHGTAGWKALGGVMLCITGAEALFADLGHFSIPSIGISFSFVVYPCVLVAYLGQGAYLIHHPEDVGTAFYASVPDQFFWPMLIIATLAAIVASQALITGSFSIIRQAMTLGVFPKLKIVHTGEEIEGQIYIGSINYTLMLLCIAVVAGFRADSVQLGNAYGIAVSSVMLITTHFIVLFFVVDWELSSFIVVPFYLLFALIEGAFLSANLEKVPNGGWFTLAVSFGVALIKFIWLSGQLAKAAALEQAQKKINLNDVLSVVDTQPGDDDLVSVSYHRHLTSESQPLSSNQMSAFASAAAQNLTASSVPAPGARRRGSISSRSFGHALSISSGRRLGSDLLPSLSTQSTSSSSRLQLHSTLGIHPPASVSRPASSRIGSIVQGRNSLDKQSHPGQHPLLGAVPEDPELEAARQLQTGTVRPPGPLGEAKEQHPVLEPLSEVSSKDTALLVEQDSVPVTVADPTYLPTNEVVGIVTNLARLRGVGLYYTDNSHGIPPVMWTFLRNVEAVHEFVILLQNRFLPIPYLTDAERLAAVPVPGLPNFYRVVARYGYMDVVNHGQDFADSVIEYIASQLSLVADPTGTLLQSAAGTHELSHETPFNPMLAPSMAKMPSMIHTQGSILRSPFAAGDMVSDEAAREAKRTDAFHTLEVLRHASHEGIVYYLGHTHLQMKQLSNGGVMQTLHDLWYGELFKTMAINSYAETEAWHIPASSLVELGITVEI